MKTRFLTFLAFQNENNIWCCLDEIERVAPVPFKVLRECPKPMRAKVQRDMMAAGYGAFATIEFNSQADLVRFSTCDQAFDIYRHYAGG